MIRSLPMTENEIRVMYRDAKNKNKQIQILADMNGCGISDIRKVLGLSVKNKIKPTVSTERLTGVSIVTPQSADKFYVEESMKEITDQISNIRAGNADNLFLTKVIQVDGCMPADYVRVVIAPKMCSQLELWESNHPRENSGALGLTD
ncbi:MAG: hypothetical protein QM221_09340 [Bacillota bacterium]|nr:hypothetical protein [Bacillota bacterium]